MALLLHAVPLISPRPAESPRGSPAVRWVSKSATAPWAGQTSAQSPGCSSPPPSPPGEPVDIRPPYTSVASSMGSATTPWMMAGGTVFSRRYSAILRPLGPLYLRRLQLRRLQRSERSLPAYCDGHPPSSIGPIDWTPSARDSGPMRSLSFSAKTSSDLTRAMSVCS